MPERLERAKRYRHRAEELRAMAEDWRDPETLHQVTELALDYERMAAELERLAAGDLAGGDLQPGHKH